MKSYYSYYIEIFFKHIADANCIGNIEILDTGASKAKKKTKTSFTSIPEELKDFYIEFDFLKLNWRHNNFKEASGELNILSYSNLFDKDNAFIFDPEVIVVDEDFYFSEKVKLKGDFKRIDYLEDNHSVGFFNDQQMDNELYYCVRNYFYKLNINFEQYFQLMCQAKAYSYWQTSILYAEYNYEHFKVSSNQFKHGMSLAFPSFNFDDFINLYKQFKKEYLSLI